MTATKVYAPQPGSSLLSSRLQSSPYFCGGVMPVVQVDLQWRYAYAANPDGWYYWTSTYYLDPPDPTNFVAYLPALHLAARSAALYETKENRARVTMPPHSGTVILDTNTHDQFGESVLGGPTILENVARLSFWVGRQYVGYKLLRGAIPVAEVEDGRLSDNAYSWLVENTAVLLLDAGICTDAGVPIERVEVSPLIHTWQLRHGTKRRQRVVFA